MARKPPPWRQRLLFPPDPSNTPDDPDTVWLGVAPLTIEGVEVPINRYFLNHPEMVLGTWTSKDTLYGEGYSILSNGDLTEQLKATIRHLPEYAPLQATTVQDQPATAFTPHRPNATSAKAASSSPTTAPSGR
jgi:hypothetical protein